MLADLEGTPGKHRGRKNKNVVVDMWQNIVGRDTKHYDQKTIRGGVDHLEIERMKIMMVWACLQETTDCCYQEGEVDYIRGYEKERTSKKEV